MRIGNGGIQLEDVEVSVSTDSNSATILFLSEGKATDRTLSYSAEYFHAPSRLQMTFFGMSEKAFITLKEKLSVMKAVRDIYRVQSVGEKDITFVIVLNGLYNYELMEFSHPGSLTLNFYQDAYYTEEERKPGETIYFLKTNILDYEITLKENLVKYEAENPAQIKKREGEYQIVIGEYSTREEAEAAYDKMLKKYGSKTELYIDNVKVEDIPE